MDSQIADVKARLFGHSWLELADAEASEHAASFPTNGDRFAAQELQKRLDVEGFTRKGFTLQAIAAGWHHKSAGQLREIGDLVGRERILVMHGDVDRMITVPHAEVLVSELGEGVERVVFEGAGHGLMMERRSELLEAIERMARKGLELGKT